MPAMLAKPCGRSRRGFHLRAWRASRQENDPMAKKPPKEYPIAAPTAAEWREGKKRALAMIQDMARCEQECIEAEPKYVTRPQHNIVYAHLFGVDTTMSLGVQVAFASVLTHYIGNIVHGVVPDAHYLSRTLPRAPAMVWPTKCSATVSMSPAAVARRGQVAAPEGVSHG
jgi:hypothetical protein